MCVSVCGHGSGHGALFIYWGRVPAPVFLCGSVSLPLFTEITSKYPCKCVCVCVCADGLCPLFPGYDASKRHVFMCVRNRFFPLWCNQRVRTSLETALKFKPGFLKKNKNSSITLPVPRPAVLSHAFVLWEGIISTACVKQSSVVFSFRSQIFRCGGWRHRRRRSLWWLHPATHALQWPAENVVRLICLTFRCFDASPANFRTFKEEDYCSGLKGSV